jgi:hypothetical protein
MRRGAHIQPEQCSGRMRQGNKFAGPVRAPERNSQKRGANNPEQNRAGEFSHDENHGQRQAEARQLYFALGKIAQPHKSRRIRDNNPRISQTHKGDE